MANKQSIFENNKSSVPADDVWLNMVNSEFKNVCTGTGQTIDAGVDQTIKGMAIISSQASLYCVDTGTANAYVLNPVSPLQAPPVIRTGMSIKFATGNANTGSTNINAYGFGNILAKNQDGTNLGAGDIPANVMVEMYYNGTNWILIKPATKATTTTQGIVYLNNPILLKNTTGSTNTKIDFLAGNAQLNDGSGQVVLSSTLTKILQSSGAWTAGNDANGLFSGGKANNTWYYAFVIQNTTTGVVDAGFDSSPVGANVPAGWKITKLIHCLRTDGSGNIMTGDYFPDNWFYWTTEQTEYSSSASASTAINLSYVPKEIPSMGHLTAYAANSGSTGGRQFRVGISSTNIWILGGSISYGDQYSNKDGGQIPIKIVSSNPQVYIISTGTGSSILKTHGFKPLI